MSTLKETLTNKQTNKLNMWCTTFIEKLTVAQLVKYFPHFMEPEG